MRSSKMPQDFFPSPLSFYCSWRQPLDDGTFLGPPLVQPRACCCPPRAPFPFPGPSLQLKQKTRHRKHSSPRSFFPGAKECVTPPRVPVFLSRCKKERKNQRGRTTRGRSSRPGFPISTTRRSRPPASRRRPSSRNSPLLLPNRSASMGGEVQWQRRENSPLWRRRRTAC